MGTITYNGKVSFSSIVPGLNSASSTLQQKNQEVSTFLSNQQKNVDALSSRVTSIQTTLATAQQIATDAQTTLASAQNLLTAAESLTSSISNALTASGIYSYNYVGQIGSFGADFATQFASGLPSSVGSTENVAVVLLVIGAGASVTTAVNNITSVMGQIGNNASKMVADFQALP